MVTTTNSARGHVPAPDLREGTGHYQLSVRHNGQRMLQSGTHRGPLSDPDGGRQSRERTAWCEPYVPGRRLLVGGRLAQCAKRASRLWLWWPSRIFVPPAIALHSF